MKSDQKLGYKKIDAYGKKRGERNSHVEMSREAKQKASLSATNLSARFSPSEGYSSMGNGCYRRVPRRYN